MHNKFQYSTAYVHFECFVDVLCIANSLPDGDPVGSKHEVVCDLNKEY
jgi:hypothetical protein